MPYLDETLLLGSISLKREGSTAKDIVFMPVTKDLSEKDFVILKAVKVI